MGSWLYLEEDSDRYFLGTWTWVSDKSQQCYIHDSLPKDIKKIIYEQQWGGFLKLLPLVGRGRGGRRPPRQGRGQGWKPS